MIRRARIRVSIEQIKSMLNLPEDTHLVGVKWMPSSGSYAFEVQGPWCPPAQEGGESMFVDAPESPARVVQLTAEQTAQLREAFREPMTGRIVVQ